MYYLLISLWKVSMVASVWFFEEGKEVRRGSRNFSIKFVRCKRREWESQELAPVVLRATGMYVVSLRQGGMGMNE